jgi:hypothetical protein
MSFSSLYSQPEIQWIKAYDGNGEFIQFSGIQLSDSGYIFTGNNQFYENNYDDIWLFKTNSQGDSLWLKELLNDNLDGSCSIKQTKDNGYIISGFKGMQYFLNGEAWIIKTDSFGDTIWTKSFKENIYYSDIAKNVLELSDSEYLVSIHNLDDFYGGLFSTYLVKMSIEGDILWTKDLGQIMINSMIESPDSCYVLIGEQTTIDPPYDATDIDVIIIKITSEGDSLWEKRYDFEFSDNADYICSATDSGFLLTGYSFPKDEFKDWYSWIFKINSNGDSLWLREFESEYGNHKFIEIAQDGNIIVSSDRLFFKADNTGSELWRVNDLNIDIHSFQETLDGGYIVAGKEYDTSYLKMIKFSPEPTTIDFDNYLYSANTFSLNQNYPNPFNPLTTISVQVTEVSSISLDIFNISGQKVTSLFSGTVTPGIYNFVWNTVDNNGKKLSSGLYFVKLSSNSGITKVRKMVLMK